MLGIVLKLEVWLEFIFKVQFIQTIDIRYCKTGHFESPIFRNVDLGAVVSGPNLAKSKSSFQHSDLFVIVLRPSRQVTLI